MLGRGEPRLPARRSLHCTAFPRRTRVGATGDLDADLVYAALSTPAPTLSAFMLKLEVLAAPGEWNAFDNDTWPIFLADMRRFACLKAISKKGGRQS